MKQTVVAYSQCFFVLLHYICHHQVLCCHTSNCVKRDKDLPMSLIIVIYTFVLVLVIIIILLSLLNLIIGNEYCHILYELSEPLYVIVNYPLIVHGMVSHFLCFLNIPRKA